MAIHPTANTPAGNLQSGARVALLGMAANIVLGSAKILAGIFGHSYVLIADGIESALDVAGSIVIWAGLMFASRPPDASHPYGHGKAEPLAAVAVSVFVVLAALGLAIESIREIVTPHHLPAPFTLGVLVVVVIVKELLFRSVLQTAEHTGSSAVKTDAWHHRADAITSGAAFIGISIALLGGKGYESADDFAALVAAGIIAINAALLLKPAVSELLDTAPPKEFADDVRR